MITDPNHAIKATLADMLSDLQANIDHTLDPAKVFAELKRQDLLETVFPDGGDDVGALTKKINLWSGSTLLDAQNRPYRLRRVPSAKGFQFGVRFQTGPPEI